MESAGRLSLFLVLSFFFVLLASGAALAADFRVGVSPSIIDLGSVQPGSVQTVAFNVVTPSEEPLQILLEPERGSLDFFSNPQYAELVTKYSEEDVVPWVTFIENPFQLSLTDRPVSGPQSPRGSREVKFLIKVPEDAEPGVHTVKINPVPASQVEGVGGAGARVVAITTVTVLFNVPGDAARDGEVTSIVQGNYAGTRMVVNSYFENTGTVTISVRSEQMLYLLGGSVENTSSSRVYIKPGETTNLQTFIQAADLEPGDYDLFTTAAWHTGTDTRNATIVIAEPPPVPVSAPVEEGFPIWIIILAVVIVIAVSVLIYKWYG